MMNLFRKFMRSFAKAEYGIGTGIQLKIVCNTIGVYANDTYLFSKYACSFGRGIFFNRLSDHTAHAVISDEGDYDLVCIGEACRGDFAWTILTKSQHLGKVTNFVQEDAADSYEDDRIITKAFSPNGNTFYLKFV